MKSACSLVLCITDVLCAFSCILLRVRYPWPKRMGVTLQCWWADELLIGLLDDRK